MPEPAVVSPRPFLQGPRPLAFAHRGGSLLWPENTMLAFRGAVEMGYRYLETDLHATRDGALVLIHDDTLERTTNGSGPAWEHTLTELKLFDAGYHFSPDGGLTYPYRGQGVTVPTLEEVMEAFPEVRLNVEIKQEQPPAVAAVADFIEKRGLHDRLLVASFRDRVIRDFRSASGGAVATSAAQGRGPSLLACQPPAAGARLPRPLRCPPVACPLRLSYGGGPPARGGGPSLRPPRPRVDGGRAGGDATAAQPGRGRADVGPAGPAAGGGEPAEELTSS